MGSYIQESIRLAEINREKILKDCFEHNASILKPNIKKKIDNAAQYGLRDFELSLYDFNLKYPQFDKNKTTFIEKLFNEYICVDELEGLKWKSHPDVNKAFNSVYYFSF